MAFHYAKTMCMHFTLIPIKVPGHYGYRIEHRNIWKPRFKVPHLDIPLRGISKKN
jgi:hypothetical protein